MFKVKVGSIGGLLGVTFLTITSLAWAMATPEIGYDQALTGASAPLRIAIGPQGYIYVSDTAEGQVLVYNPAGQLIQSIKGLNKPLGIAVSASGAIYIGEEGGQRVTILDKQGKSVGYLRDGGDSAQFLKPNDITLDTEGNIYVVDSLAPAIKVFYPNGNSYLQFGSSGSNSGQFRFPVGIAYDPILDRLLVSDQLNNRVQVFSRQGNYITQFYASRRLEGVTLDPLGRVYLVDTFLGQVSVYTYSAGSYSPISGFYIGSWEEGPGQLRIPSGIRYHPQGKLFVASTGTHQIQSFILKDIVPPITPPQTNPLPNTTLSAGDILSWQGSYPPGTTFTLELADNTGFTNALAIAGLTKNKVSLIQLLFSGLISLQDGIRYYWRVKAIDPSGNASEWAEGDSFIFNNIIVTVDAHPEGSWLYANANHNFEGIYTGQTLYQLNFLPAATYYLRLTYPGYENAYLLTDTRDGNNRSVSINLKAGLQVAFEEDRAIKLTLNGQPIPLPRSVPQPVDWDNDGILDLVVGTASGEVLLFHSSQDTTGVYFQGPSRLAQIAANAAPVVVDWDADFKKDLLVGEESGKVWLFLNEGSDAHPELADPLEITANNTPTGNLSRLVNRNAAPAVADWDNDGLPDLLVGGEDGRVVVYGNDGYLFLPILGEGKAIKYQENDLIVNGDAKPQVIDLNRDDKKDLILGAADGSVKAFLNEGYTPGLNDPVLSPYQVLLPNDEERQGASACLVPWDQNPGLDLIYGTASGYIEAISGNFEAFAAEYLNFLNTLLDQMDGYIQLLPESSFDKNPGERKNALSNKIGAVKQMVTDSELTEASQKLTHDLRAKFDGSQGGQADNDWIINPDSQAVLVGMVDYLIAEMQQALADAGLK